MRILDETIYDGSGRCIYAVGTSSETKPTDNVISGSIYFEVDTSKAYMYNEASHSWVEAKGSVDEAAIEAAVTEWLEAHPEATTTVADGSITEPKLASALLTKINNSASGVSQLSDEIDNIGLEMAYCSDDKLQKFGENIYIQKPSALNTQATICVFNASAGVTYTINLTTKEEIQGTIYVYVYKDASVSAWKSYVIDASTPTKNVNFTLSTDTKITIKYLEQNSTNTILTGVITVSSDEAETKAKETAYLLNSPLTLGIPMSVRQNYFLQDNGDNTGAIASALNFTLLQYDLSNVVGTIDVKTVLNGSSCIGFYADGVYSPVTKNQGEMQIPADAEYLYVSLYTGSGATINDVVVRADFSVQVAINRSVIYGKKLGVFGDSIVAGNGYSGGWAKIIAARNHMSVDNAAISGGTIMNISGHPHIPEQIANIDSDCDYVLFDGGVNDFALQDFVLGEISANYINSPAYDTTTFIGSLERLLYDLRSAFVGKKIGYVFNHRIYRDNDVNGTVKYSEFEATVKSTLKKWGVAYVDIAEDSPSLNLLDAYKDAYTAHTESFPNGDGWHPNYEGYKTYYCNKIESWMKTL